MDEKNSIEEEERARKSVRARVSSRRHSRILISEDKVGGSKEVGDFENDNMSDPTEEMVGGNFAESLDRSLV